MSGHVFQLLFGFTLHQTQVQLNVMGKTASTLSKTSIITTAA